MVSEFLGLRTRAPYFVFLTYIFLLIGSRYEIGPDWITYQLIYEDSCQPPFLDFVGIEFLYKILNCFSHANSLELFFVNSICSLVILCSCFYFAKLCSTPASFYILALPYFLYVISLGYTRQSVSIALFMLSTYLSVNSRTRGSWIASLIGVGFHKSIILYAGLLFFKGIPRLLTYCLLIPAFILLFFYFSGGYVDYLMSNYINGDFSSSGALFRVISSCICSTAYYLKIRGYITSKSRNVINIFAPLPYLYIFFLIVFPEQSTAIDRISLYQTPINILILSYALNTFQKKYFLLLQTSIFFLSCIYFEVWLSYSAFSSAWFPYKSYLLPF